MQPWEHRLNGLGRILPEHIEITCHRNRKSRVWNIHRLRRWGLKFIAQTLAFIAALASATISASADNRPDVLFIAIDDMNDWTTLFDPSNPIRTPNLERLAARGAFFTRAYTASPGCNPSRTALLTGLLPTTSGVYENSHAWRAALPNVVTLPKYFEGHGYATRGAGKIFHHGPTGAEPVDNPSFQDFFPLQPRNVASIRK